MAFNSWQFIAFFPLVFLVHYALPQRLRWMWLLTTSVYFYGIFQPLLLLQILLATAAGYFLALKIEAEPDGTHKKKILAWAVYLLIGNLFVFKYTSFVNESVRDLLSWFGVSYGVPEVHLLLPIGISFYTFQLVSYVVDVYRGTVPAERHFGIFALYVCFFPKLVAGPIERAKSLLPQLHARAGFSTEQVVAGLQLAAWGMFKKVVISDRVAPFVNQVYGDPTDVTGVAITLATLLFAIQVYTDFSGYTDIALGCSQMLGYRLSPNFRRPYFATSIQDFWKRWHISLTSWLTDYIYTPLTRTRKIKLKWYYMMLLSLFLTFLASGLWHGAQWHFVAWGALHGAYLVISTMTQKWRRKGMKKVGLNRVPRFHHGLRVFNTFVLVCVAYILFQAQSLSDAFYMFTHIGTGWGMAVSELRAFVDGRWAELSFAGFGTAVAMGVDLLQERGGSVREMLKSRPTWTRWTLSTGLALSIALMGAFYDEGQEFIYFQF
ncbi:MAG: MBOAT family protein [Myxococcales bacterium]|nr:MBOAT family protein [Myxococcales bacterium]